jgi:GAF domain-containing protein
MPGHQGAGQNGPEVMSTRSQDLEADLRRENARLLSELRAAQDRQNASTEILRAIASTSGNAEQSLQQIAEITARLFGAPSVTFRLADGWEWGKSINFGPSSHHVRDAIPAEQRRLDGDNLPGTVYRENRQIHIPDLDNVDPAMAHWPIMAARAEGTRTVAGTPLRRQGKAIGTLIVFRDGLAPFTAEELALQQSFADQAAIAIENARLFDEVQAKTRDLSESLQQQTATSDVLKVISRSAFDLQTVLDALTESAARLCGADMATVTREREAGHFHHVTNYNFPSDWVDYSKNIALKPGRGSMVGRALLERKPVQVADVLADPEYTYGEQQKKAGYRTYLGVPLLREGQPIGVFSLCRRTVESFTDKQIELLSTFADQAVIAIENVRLFDEVKARTEDFRESLEYQTAISDVLNVISRSPSDIQPVLDTIAGTAKRLCQSENAYIFRLDGDRYHLVASKDVSGERIRFLSDNPIAPDRDSTVGRVALERRPVHIMDAQADPEYKLSMVGDHGYRCILGVPLLRDGIAIGVIILTRGTVQPFLERQIELVSTFADQALIAIENVRLFDEVQARTRDLSESLEQQTATSEVLKTISASPGELEPVFQAMLENAVRLCGAKFAMLFLYEDNEFRAAGKWNLPPAWEEFLGKNAILANPRIPMGRVVSTKQPVHVEDVLTDQAYIEGYPGMVGVAELGGARTLLQVPMLKDNELVGTIGIYRQEVLPFTQKQIALVQSFAAQAVIAVENARLLNELRQRTDDLTKSLNDLRTAQDRLVQTEKLASLGQLTAGIAHEIKNPLNFVNNFSALSVELTGELNEALKSAALSDKIRQEVDELTGMLKDNLEKVVQHGKRADSIVKNMLLHSREGSGEHRPADINALLDESLNLAYHGARAEKSEFNITLQRHFDKTAGTVEVFPQEITRVFLNLISNGFYAATKRKKENGGTGFEPVLSATTSNCGESVEIRIRDNGTGIPAEVKEKMFNPFFTTKPAGEGTGLGLSMSHDIIVKQHGGSIEVETEPGQFTEFRIVLPRTSNISNKNTKQN